MIVSGITVCKEMSIHQDDEITITFENFKDDNFVIVCSKNYTKIENASAEKVVFYDQDAFNVTVTDINKPVILHFENGDIICNEMGGGYKFDTGD